jgi:outer membrane protein OmpA-like peptidoglycan-associated protein
VVGVCSLTSAVSLAQTPTAPASDVTARQIKAIGYQVGSNTRVDLKATGLLAGADGEARVEPKPSVTTVEVKVRGLESPMKFGTEFLAYVVWAVSPEGRAINLGELRTDDDGKGTLKTTTQLQSFSLFVTAEPYPAVRQPSEMLVLENGVRKDTKGRLFVVDDYKLMMRSQYQKMSNPLALTVDLKSAPIEMYQARNAVEIAKSRGADRYAPEVFSKAQGGLELAENALARKADKKQIISLARQTQQSSEDARALTAERVEQERVAAERAAAAAQAKAQAEAKAAQEAALAKQRADEAARQQAELAAAREAQLRAEAAAKQAEAARQEAQLRAEAAAREAEATRQEAQLRAEAAAREVEATRQQAQLRAEAAAKEAEAARQQAELRAAAAAREARLEAEAAAKEASAREAAAEAERARKAAEDLRAKLLEQFNRILETRDSERGLVITMADVLFDTGQYELRPQTREALARLSGVVLAHEGLKLEVEGHTDSTGSDDLNQTLSERRAGAVRAYLIEQGLAGDAITAHGFGKAMPVGDNSTAAGRQKNRRVELIVSGEVIGQQIGR